MKKIILSILCLGTVLSAFSQDKKVQAGLGYQLGFGFNNPETNFMKKNGVGIQNAVGLQLNFNFTEKLAFATGIEFDFESFKYKAGDQDTYYRFADTDILQKEEYTGSNTGPATMKTFHLTERKYNATVISIPTFLMFKMKPLGSFTPYGKFGARTGFIAKTTATDQGEIIDGLTATKAENVDMSTKGDVFFLRSQIGFAAGTEWEFSGGTALFAEFGFYYGFTPLHYGKAITGNDEERDMHLYTSGLNNGQGNDDYFTIKSTQKHLALKIGILF